MLSYLHLRGQGRGSVPTFGGSIPALPAGLLIRGSAQRPNKRQPP